MQYLLMIYAPEDVTDQTVLSDITARHIKLAQDLHGAGVAFSGERLKRSDTATTAVWTGSDHTLRDGPFAETREQLAGYYVIDVADLDEALKWARQIPLSKGGAVEVRPIWPMG
jgi:hypothetical protein